MPLPIFKTLITVSDFGLLSYLLSLMIKQFQNNNSLKSWSTIFHVQCVIWLTLRGCFWFGTIMTSNVSSELYLKILYWLPCPFEYGAFLTIPMFFAQVIYPSESRAVVSCAYSPSLHNSIFSTYHINWVVYHTCRFHTFSLFSLG